jgi:hypothetical protein
MGRHSILLCAVMLVSLSNYSIRLLAQSKLQTETVLGNMTSEEIEKKLKELGITREEELDQASAFNINLEEYLSKMRSIKPEK